MLPGFPSSSEALVPPPTRSQFSFKKPLHIRKARQYRASDGDQPASHALRQVMDACWSPGSSSNHTAHSGVEQPHPQAILPGEHALLMPRPQRSQSTASASSAIASNRQDAEDHAMRYRHDDSASAFLLAASHLLQPTSDQDHAAQQPQPQTNLKQALTRVIGGFTGGTSKESGRRNGRSDGNVR